MNYNIQICNNVLKLVSSYNESTMYFEKNAKKYSEKLYTYFEECPTKVLRLQIKYMDTLIVPDENGEYIELLKQYSINDLLNIMYLCLTTVTPSFTIGRHNENNKTYAYDIKPPYEAINGAIIMLERLIINN